MVSMTKAPAKLSVQKATAKPAAAKKVVARPVAARKTAKHIVPRASAEEISRTVGVTARDREVVEKVLVKLGFVRSPG
jgi:hypothetical protein